MSERKIAPEEGIIAIAERVCATENKGSFIRNSAISVIELARNSAIGSELDACDEALALLGGE